MNLERESPCKVNLLLNILGRRQDGFHELETVMHPVALYDRIVFEPSASGVQLSCSDPALPTDSRNLVHRAATLFLNAATIREGVRIHLEKRIPQAAGLGGGSGNAATTLLGLNDLFGAPLAPETLPALAAQIGSDVPFFLQSRPALATGRGEQIRSLGFFKAMEGAAFVLIHPGFGISTAWAYQQLARYPSALNGEPGRAQQLINLLQAGDLEGGGRAFYNSLEAPALEKFPLLRRFQQFLRENGAPAALMSGSGSTTFAIARSQTAAEALAESFRRKFGSTHWMAVVPVPAA